jgi:hypothetical protein
MRPFRRLRRKWEYRIKIYFKEVGSVDVNWSDVLQSKVQWRAVVNTATNLFDSVKGR